MEYIYLIITIIFIAFVTYILYINFVQDAPKTEVLAQNNSEKLNSSIELFKLEFEYAKETAMESQRDRLTLVNFYIILFTSIFAGAVGINEYFGQKAIVTISLSLLLLSFLGIIFNIFIIRLRQAWNSSAKAMNRIKEFFIEYNLEVEEYLLWKPSTLPKSEKLFSISFFASFVIIFLGTTSLVASLVFLNTPVVLCILIPLLYFILQISIYYYFLKYSK